MSVSAGAPGWYVDPHNPTVLRWFDGAVWTTHTSPRAQQPASWQPRVGPVGPTTPSYAPGQPTPLMGSTGYPQTMPPYGNGWPQQGPLYQPGVKVLPDGAVLAEWWRRLVARLIDGLVIVVIVAVAWIPWYGDLLAQLDAMNGDPTATLGIMALLSGVISLVYDVGLLAWKQATLGKMLLGTVVRRATDPRLTVGDAFKRQILPAVGTLISLLSNGGSYLSLIDSAWLLWDPKRQTLHDKISGTVVVLKSTTMLAPRDLR